MLKLLPLLATGDILSHHKIWQLLGIKRVAFSALIEGFIRTEVLRVVPAHGGNSSSQRNPGKYLFSSPALRQLYFQAAGLNKTYQTQRGLLLEDLAGLHYSREFTDKGTSFLSYPYYKLSHKNLCDFILQTSECQLAIEFGLGRKAPRQVIATMQCFKCDFGLTFANQSLTLSDNQQVVMVPLDYFYLI